MSEAGAATYPMKLAALVAQAAERHAPIVCPECGTPILPGQKFAFDHRFAKGRGGANQVPNLRALHAESDAPFDCHDRKTFGGRARATTLRSDVFEIHKTDRLARAAQSDDLAVTRWASRPFQKSQRKLPSRPMRTTKPSKEKTP